MAVALKGVQHW